MSAKAAPPPQFPSTKIITLLESNKTNKSDPNGIFNIQLNEELTLKEGDSISIQKSFIDQTTSETAFIQIDNDNTELTITHGIYIKDLAPNLGTGAGVPKWGKWSIDPTERPNAQNYIMQNQAAAPLHTFLEWTVSDNPGLTGTQPGSPWEVELIGLPAEPNGFQYEIGASEPSGAVATHPVDFFTPVIADAKYMIGGHCSISTNPTAFEFLFYPWQYVPTGSKPGINDHTAVITRWTTLEGAILGWKIKKNDDTTETVENRKWLFSSDADGYNYFPNLDPGHILQLGNLRMCIRPGWNSTEGQTGPFPGCQMVVPDTAFPLDLTRAKRYSVHFTADQYKYDPDNAKNSGIGELTRQFGKMIMRRDIPNDTGFRDDTYGWARDDGWNWWNVNFFNDPYGKQQQPMWPPVHYLDTHPPYITYLGNPPDGIDCGFIQPYSQFYNKTTKGMVCQPWQLQGSKPVSAPSSGGIKLTPRTYTTKITIPLGIYTYPQLAETLTDLLNKQNTPITGLSNNPLDPEHPPNEAGYSSSYLYQTTFETMGQFNGYDATYPRTYPNDYVYAKTDTDERTLPDGTVLPAIPGRSQAAAGTQPYWVSEDGEHLFEFNANEVYPLTAPDPATPTVFGIPHAFGASQFSILYDDTSQSFNLAQAHTPIYISGVSQPGGDPNPPGPQIIQQIRDPANNPDSFLGTLLSADTSSGIFITDVQPESLWFDKMGFPRSMITTSHTNSELKVFSVNSFVGDTTLDEVQVDVMNLERGRNITGLYLGMDSLVQKNNFYGQLPGGTAAGGVVETWQRNIEANTPLGLRGSSFVEVVEDDPFYSIEIRGINKNELFGQTVKNNLIMSNVGKYYSNGQFVEGENGIAYTHQGNPITIRDIGVRILNSVGQPEQSLGPKSAIILQLNTDK